MKRRNNARRKDEITKYAMQNDEKRVQKDKNAMRNIAILNSYFSSFCLASFCYFVFSPGVFSPFLFRVAFFFVISSFRLLQIIAKHYWQIKYWSKQRGPI